MTARNILVVLITAAIAIGGLTCWINQPGPPPVDGSSEWGTFEGPYRNASIVHDVYCESMSEPRTRRCHPRGADGFETLDDISGPEGRHIVSRCA